MEFNNTEPLARDTDDWTSHRAAEEHTKTGRRSEHKHMVLRAALRRHPLDHYTGREFARDTGIAHEIVHKRFPDLLEEGLMFKVGYRTCEVTGKKATLWSAYRPELKEE